MKTLTKISLSLLLLITFLVWAKIARSPEQSNGFDIYFFDVGQGDAALLQNKNFQIVIDGGPDGAILEKLAKIMPIGDKTIERIVLTHPHADHLIGLNEVIKRYQIERVYLNGVNFDSDQYRLFKNLIDENKVQQIIPEIGESESIENYFELTFLWPGKKYLNQNLENLNNSSLVLSFCNLKKCLLFLGDSENDGTQEMVKYYINKKQVYRFKSDLIKASHHGSANGLNSELYSMAKASKVVISVAKNNQYGHPHDIYLKYLNSQGISSFRTDVNGDIHLILAEESMDIAT